MMQNRFPGEWKQGKRITWIVLSVYLPAALKDIAVAARVRSLEY